MHYSEPEQVNPILTNATLQGSCPLGGVWYTCRAQKPTFLGCCVSNPCNGIGCPAADLRPAGLGAGAGQRECENDSSFEPNIECPSGGDWYGCQTHPTFQGCCEGANPCELGHCPDSSLRPASFVEDFNADKIALPCGMNRPTESTAIKSPTSNPPSTIKPQQTSRSGVTALAAPSTLPTTLLTSLTAIPPSSTSPPTPTPHPNNGHNAHLPALAGGIGGGVLFLLLLTSLLILHYRRQKQSRQHHHANIPKIQAQPQLLDKDKDTGEAPLPLTPATVPPTPGPPPYQSSQAAFPESPHAIRRNQVHEMGTSTTGTTTSSSSSGGSGTRCTSKQMGDGQGLGIAGVRPSSEMLGLGGQMGGRGEKGSEMLYTSWQTYQP